MIKNREYKLFGYMKLIYIRERKETSYYTKNQNANRGTPSSFFLIYMIFLINTILRTIRTPVLSY